jgi:hypothetical protein
MIHQVKAFIKRRLIHYLNKQFQSGSLNMLFIQCHMRSGSSLLVHILNSHPKIIGYGETHNRYCNEASFGETAFKIYRLFKKLPIDEEYILDKIVQSHYVKDVNLFNKVKTIFLIRSPLQALPSIHKLNPYKYTPSVTFDYYAERMENIQKTTLNLDPELWTYVTYNELINNQDKPFRRIEKLLKLDAKLSGKYETMWSTGVRHIGDGSQQIQKGRIEKNKKPKEIPESFNPFLEKANEKYAACLHTLKQADHAYLS